jgi:hypothetical protein
VFVLLQVAPTVLEDNEIVLPVQILMIPPEITEGTGKTVATAVLEQPVANVLVTIVVDIPELNTITPVSSPVVALMVATDGLLMDHVPPDGVAVSVAVCAGHTDADTITGNGFIVTSRVTGQPVPEARKVILALPAFTPVTTPVLLTVAIPVLLLVHVPLAFVRAVVAAWHKSAVPVMADGNAVTVTTVVLKQPAATV